MNSGAEAVESCIKAVRKWGYKVKGVPEGKAEIIVCENNFHGRTVTIVGFSTEQQYRDGYAPFTPGFKIIPYGDAQALEDAITPNTVGFMVEPIQGEAGIIVPPAGYLRDVRRICTEHDIVLMTDEIQTGLGRTGKLLAEEHEGVEADLTMIGKALVGWLLPGLGRPLEQGGARRVPARRSRQHVRRQSAGLRDRAHGAQGARRRGHDRKRCRRWAST